MSRLRLALCVAALATHSVASSASATVMFMGLGDLPGGPFASFAFAVSGGGSVVVGTSISAPNPVLFQEAFRWTQAEGMVGLGALPSPATPTSTACGASVDGVGVTCGDWQPARTDMASRRQVRIMADSFMSTRLKECTPGGASGGRNKNPRAVRPRCNSPGLSRR